MQVQGLYFNTIPSSAASLVGQRKQLSAGDIKQALDAYRCRSGNKHNGIRIRYDAKTAISGAEVQSLKLLDTI